MAYFLWLANRPSTAAFCSPFGGGRYKNCRMNKSYIWDRHTHIWDRHTLPMKNSLYPNFFFVYGQICSQIVLKPLPWKRDSKSVLRFRIGKWEVGYFCRKTFKQTNIRLYDIDRWLEGPCIFTTLLVFNTNIVTFMNSWRSLWSKTGKNLSHGIWGLVFCLA